MKNVNILVVDDRPEGLLAVQAVLDQSGYNLIMASSGHEALKRLLADDFAVILLDVQMPVMNGFETAAMIKTRDKSRHIPIIFMSAINQDEQYVYQGYGVGAVDYMLKPFDPYILKSKVNIFVDLYRKNRIIQEQARKLHENEVKTYTQTIDRMELESLRRYQYLADSIPQIVFRLLPDGNYDFFNKEWFEYTGQSAGEARDFLWQKAIHPDDVGKITNKFQSSLKSGLEGECRIMDHQGIYRWHLIRMEPETFADDQMVNSWLGTANDIEARKRSEETQRFLAEAGALLISSLDYKSVLQKIVQLAVPQLADWCAFDILEQGQLKTVAMLHRNPQKAALAGQLHKTYLSYQNTNIGPAKVLQTGQPQVLNQLKPEDYGTLAIDEKQKELMNALSDKSIMILPLPVNRKIIGTVTLVFSESGRVYDEQYLKVARELATRVALAYENSRLYDLAQDAIEARNEFLSIASHELNTPITSLKLQLQMAQKILSMGTEKLPIDKFQKSVESSLKQIERLISLVQILLDVSRIQSGKFILHYQSFNLQDLINEVVERYSEIMESNDCQLMVHSNLTDLTVNWDRTRIEQVMVNILTNAVKYAPGEISLQVEATSHHLTMLFQDAGEGIPQSKLSSIFDRFERVNSNDNISGLGLGLFIVKQIVEGHKGEISATSRQGEGSCFKVVLPLDPITV